MSDKIMAQLVNLTEGQTALGSKLASQEKMTKSFDDRLNSLASKVGREGGPRGGGAAQVLSREVSALLAARQATRWPSARCTPPSRSPRSPRTTNDCHRWH